MAEKTYVESFDDGPGGWTSWGFHGLEALEIRDGCAVSRSPWWVDFNHAPPGGGYLHLLHALYTTIEPRYEAIITKYGGPNRFVAGGYPTDFTDARLSVRVKGEAELRGAQMVLLAQGDLPHTRVNQVLAAQPIEITPEWSEQTIHLVPDQSQWVNMGSRHDRREMYGVGPIRDLLRNVSCDIIFVLFPLDVAPLRPIKGDPHVLRAGSDYELDTARLPKGHVLLDEVRIVFPHG